MKKSKMKLALLAFCGVLLLPQASEAAVNSIAVTDNTALYTIKFDFIAGKEDYKVPIGAVEGLAFGDDSNFMGYDVLKGKAPATDFTTAGIVLSNQPVVDKMYYEIKAGDRASFTFVAIVTVPETSSTGQYQTVMTHIPHFIGDKRVEVLENRLEQFESDMVTLNREITGATLTLVAK